MALNSLMRSEIVDAMSAHGFRRKGREFILDGPQSQLGVVALYPLALGDRPHAFGWQYGVVTPALANLQRWRGQWHTKRPSTQHALLAAQVFRPADQPKPWNAGTDPFKWIIPEGKQPTVGEGVRRTLVDEVMPNLDEWFQPTSLDAAIAGWSVRCGRICFSTKARSRVLALLPLGRDSDAVQAALADLDDDDMVRQWLSDNAS